MRRVSQYCVSDEDNQEWAHDCDHQPGPGGQPGGQLLRGDGGGREEQDHPLYQVSESSMKMNDGSAVRVMNNQSMVQFKHGPEGSPGGGGGCGHMQCGHH